MEVPYTRAGCSLVQSAAAFRKGGCPNCEFLEVRKELCFLAVLMKDLRR
jgi:hypothetical protein